ncbi:L-ascorbate metabolism protein UlaG, beta-lactamase superfamily [Paenibacillus catalpae]|uniref:L-ascorbate metabolism protein UlaG, beta-lactamase superfamily n=1 Tax=Paenibacillus catalpae TaxID=1045775 RepID=A0A1I2FTH8_9BACL|nr:MBL fold metallo-hydrolase [Paenibacillus catalpae]SFF08714.1 L-ascorbate metabolism protein UlaG, beta-lactamase superfamily [Paenibacillus catalpae]
MNVVKLPWAGIKVEHENNSLVIDPFYNFPSDLGTPMGKLYPLDEFGQTDAVLLTHVHPDHYDPEAIKRFYGVDIPIYVPMDTLEYVKGHGFTSVIGVPLEDVLAVEAFTVIPTYSVDGLGDPQIAWIVSAGGKKIIHCGDTLWHGYWWKIKNEHGPFDAAFLPVNGPVTQFPNVTPASKEPIVMTPEQAVSAAIALEAKLLVPIHFDLVNNPPFYTPAADINKRVTRSAEENQITVKWLETKETLAL